MESDPNFRWCSLDTCSQGQIHNNGLNEPVIVCQRSGCSTQTCFLHHNRWHRGLTCREYQRQIDPQFRANDITDAEKDRNPDLYGKVCPRGCGRRIYKAAGCSHMSCGFSSLGFFS
jgi:E3 ubiquitin-protein ligase RNF19B